MENCNLHEMCIKRWNRYEAAIYTLEIFFFQNLWGEIKRIYEENYGGTLSLGLWDLYNDEVKTKNKIFSVSSKRCQQKYMFI